MFLKTTKSKNYTYLQLVESYRDSGKVKHRTIANLGRLDKLMEDRSLELIGNRLLELAKSPLVNLDQVTELKRICYGNIIIEKLWERAGLSTIFDKLIRSDRRTKFSFDLSRTVLYTVVHKLLGGHSKLEAYRKKDNFYQSDDQLALHHIYQSLDFLADHKEDIEQALFASNRDLFNASIDVAFYDVTTFHFESNKADDLRDFGFSKAGKFNEVQVVLGLFTDRQGIPIGYELFSGNTFDGTTMVKALDSLTQRFNIEKVIIVADKGLNNKNNFHLIRQAGYDYIVSARIKNVSKQLQTAILEKETLKSTHIEATTGEVKFAYKTLDYPIEYKDSQGKKHIWKDKLLVTWSSKRAKKDSKDRKRHIEKAEKLIQQGTSLLQKKGAKRYVQTTEGTHGKAAQLDEEKIKQDEKWDGYYGYQYSKVNMKEEEVIEAYKGLWRIEESFRIMKSTMQVRPIFHWTEKRIKGHFIMSFISFLLERMLEKTLQEKGIHISPAQIQESLKGLQLSHIKYKENEYYLKGANGEYGAKILRALNIKPLLNVQKIK